MIKGDVIGGLIFSDNNNNSKTKKDKLLSY